MLIICCGMSRSGSTVQYQACCSLVERYGLGERSLEGGYGWLTEKMLTRERPVAVCKAHEPIEEVESRCSPGMVRWVYAHRDVRDVVVSLQQKTRVRLAGEELRGLVRDRLVGPGRYWESKPGVVVSRYEDLRDRLVGELEKIAGAVLGGFGIEVEGGALREIAGELSLERAKAVMATVDAGAGKGWDERTRLHHNHVADARSGKWREALDEGQLAIIEEEAGAWLSEHGYPVSVRD